jgi:hypothetical protein
MKQDTTYYILTYFKVTLFVAITFLTPIKGFLILISLAVLFDTLFAIYATIKLNGRKSFQSTKLFNIVVKSFFYMSTIIFVFLIDKYIIDENHLWGINLLFTKLTTGFWIYIEVKSWDETSQKLGNPPFMVILKNLITNAKKLKKDLNEIINDDEEKE